MSEENNFLDSLTVGKGAVKRPKAGLIIGEAGAGKTGLCLYAPNPFFVTWESGNDWHNGHKFINAKGCCIVPKNTTQAMDMVRKIADKTFRSSLPYTVETVIIDGLGFYQDLVYAEVVRQNPTYIKYKEECATRSIVDLGYAGMRMVMPHWIKLMAAVEYIRQSGVHVIMIAHNAKVNDVSDSSQRMKTYDIGLQVYGDANVNAFIKKHMDFIYHIYAEAQSVTIGQGDWATKQGTTSTSQFVVQTRATSLRYAKVRAMDEMAIPDSYFLTPETRKEVATQIFNDILNQ